MPDEIPQGQPPQPDSPTNPTEELRAAYQPLVSMAREQAQSQPNTTMGQADDARTAKIRSDLAQIAGQSSKQESNTDSLDESDPERDRSDHITEEKLIAAIVRRQPDVIRAPEVTLLPHERAEYLRLIFYGHVDQSEYAALLEQFPTTPREEQLQSIITLTRENENIRHMVLGTLGLTRDRRPAIVSKFLGKKNNGSQEITQEIAQAFLGEHPTGLEFDEQEGWQETLQEDFDVLGNALYGEAWDVMRHVRELRLAIESTPEAQLQVLELVKTGRLQGVIRNGFALPGGPYLDETRIDKETGEVLYSGNAEITVVNRELDRKLVEQTARAGEIVNQYGHTKEAIFHIVKELIHGKMYSEHAMEMDRRYFSGPDAPFRNRQILVGDIEVGVPNPDEEQQVTPQEYTGEGLAGTCRQETLKQYTILTDVGFHPTFVIGGLRVGNALEYHTWIEMDVEGERILLDLVNFSSAKSFDHYDTLEQAEADGLVFPNLADRTRTPVLHLTYTDLKKNVLYTT